MNPYEILEIGTDATENDIKKAYRKLARKYHPDINKESGAEKKFKEVQEAYTILSDPNKKSNYDRFGSTESGNYGFDFNQAPNGFGNFEDIFNAFFKDKNPFEQANAPIDMKARIQISLEDAYYGSEKTVNINGKKIKIKIPSGILEGEKIKIAGEGKNNGNLYLEIGIKNHDKYLRDHENLYTIKEVDVKTAILGGEIPVETFEGVIKLKIPPGTQPATKFKIKQKGMPDRKTKKKGDLFVTVQVKIPTKLTKEQKKYIEKLDF